MNPRFPASPIFLMLMLSMISMPSCHRKAAHKQFPPPPKPSPTAATATLPATPPPPELPPTTAPQPAELPTTSPKVPPPPPNKKKKHSRHKRVKKPVQQEASAPEPETLPQEPVTEAAKPPESSPPRLGPLLSAEERQEYESAVDGFLKHAEQGLSSLPDHGLNKEQEAQRVQAQNFIKQAKELRATDLPAARSLAQRADLLASNLADGFR